MKKVAMQGIVNLAQADVDIIGNVSTEPSRCRNLQYYCRYFKENVD